MGTSIFTGDSYREKKDIQFFAYGEVNSGFKESLEVLSRTVNPLRFSARSL